MNIIGVELHTPKRSELEGLAVLTAVYVVAAIAVVSSGLIEWPMVVAALIGMLSGSIAAASRQPAAAPSFSTVFVGRSCLPAFVSC